MDQVQVKVLDYLYKIKQKLREEDECKLSIW